MDVRPTEAGVGLFDGDDRIGEARPGQLEIQPPAPPDFEQASIAVEGYRGFDLHPYPSCFVCGPERADGEGLRIFPAAIQGRNLVAAPWIPGPELVSGSEAESGSVPVEMIWAALDCPGAFAFPHPEIGAVLLGELTVEIRAAVPLGEPCVIIGWEVDHSGRKHRTGTALFDAENRCLALGLGTWFEVPPPA